MNTTSQYKGIVNSVMEAIEDTRTRVGEVLHFSHTWKMKLYHNRGIFYTFLAAFLFALQTSLFRYISQDVNVIQGSFTLFVLQIFFITPVMTYKGISPKVKSRTVFTLLVSKAIFGMLAVTLFYYATNYMRIGDVTAIALSAPVFVGLFARVALKEPFGLVDCGLVLTAVGGVVLISQPHFIFRWRDDDGENTTTFLATCSAIGCCISMAMTYVINRKMGLLHVNSFVIVLYYITFASFGLGLVTTVYNSWSMPSCGTVRYALVAMAMCSFVAQSLMTYSLTITSSFLVSLVHSNEIIFAYFLEFFFLPSISGNNFSTGSDVGGSSIYRHLVEENEIIQPTTGEIREDGRLGRNIVSLVYPIMLLVYYLYSVSFLEVNN